MKYTQILILAILLISCENKIPNKFNLDVKVNGEYQGYLYLNYDKKRDSSLITKGRASFTGSVAYPTNANYTTNNISVNDRNFYIENENIKSQITISKKKIRENDIDWITTDMISGTKTSNISKDFEDYKLKYSNHKDWEKLLYNKLQKIIEQHPKHRYSGELLSDISNDTILSKEQIGKLYYMLDIEFQDPNSIKRIEFKAFPQSKIKSGDLIYDFTLPDKENNLITTKNFRGQILFIDFWASWCKPCRAQFPELTIINNDFKEKGLTILGVSIDEKNDDWLKAMEKENPKWKNLIDIEGFSGKLANKYGIFAIPYNVLVDAKGKVIAHDISLEQLRKVLDSVIINKKPIANSIKNNA